VEEGIKFVSSIYGEGDGAGGDRYDGISYMETWEPRYLVCCG
jgi:hypothetical protein